MLTILRAWVLSVFTCTGVIAAVASVMQALTGRWQHAWHNVTEINPTELVAGSFPFLVPGAIFGFTWSTRKRRPISA